MLRRWHLSGKQGITRERKVPKVAVLRTAESSSDEKDQSAGRCRLFSFLKSEGRSEAGEIWESEAQVEGCSLWTQEFAMLDVTVLQ
jgi:hypothetical protein